MRPWRCVLACALVLGATGCPQPREPPEPTGAVACEQHEDCNCGAECGALDACVDGFCEQGRALLVPCRDGKKRRREDCDAAGGK